MTKGIYVRRGNGAMHSPAGFSDAVDIEDAAHAVNDINRRIKLDKSADDYARTKARVTLSPSLDAWLKRDVP